MRVLVTGATGFVGLHIVEQLALLGASVIAVDRGEPDGVAQGVIDTYRGAIEFVRGDVRDRNALQRLVDENAVRRIVHAAALTPSLEAERDDPLTMLDVNLNGTVNVLEAARHAGVERVVFVSSTGVYGSPEGRTLPIDEDQPLHISGIYSIAKQTSEHLCARYAELYGMSTAVGRLGTAYGPYERPTSTRSRMSQVYTLVHAALEGRTLTLAGSDLPRDVCYADDIGQAFARLALADNLRWPVYNVASGEAPTLREIAVALRTLVPTFRWHETDDPTQADLVVLPPSARGPLDMSRLQADLDFVPLHPLSEGLQSYIARLNDGVRRSVV